MTTKHSISWNRAAAATAAKSLQSCLTLCDPIDGSPPGSSIPGILQARTLEWVAISFSNAWKWKVKGKSLSRVWLLVTPWTAAHQATPSMGFSRQEYWSGVPLPSPEIELTYCFLISYILYKTMRPPLRRIRHSEYLGTGQSGELQQLPSDCDFIFPVLPLWQVWLSGLQKNLLGCCFLLGKQSDELEL